MMYDWLLPDESEDDNDMYSKLTLSDLIASEAKILD